MASQAPNQQLCLLYRSLFDYKKTYEILISSFLLTIPRHLTTASLDHSHSPFIPDNFNLCEHLKTPSAMDKKTPSKPTKPTENITSPELPITIYPQQRADSSSNKPREIQETPARPKGGVTNTSSPVQQRSQGLYQEMDIDDGDLAENEDRTEGHPSFNRSSGKKMKFGSQVETAKRVGEMDSEMENTGHVPERETAGVERKDWAYPTGMSKSATVKKEEKQRERDKTPEQEELPEEVPETPQPERKSQKMDDEWWGNQ